VGGQHAHELHTNNGETCNTPSRRPCNSSQLATASGISRLCTQNLQLQLLKTATVVTSTSSQTHAPGLKLSTYSSTSSSILQSAATLATFRAASLSEA
jgi:hypothetical protein